MNKTTVHMIDKDNSKMAAQYAKKCFCHGKGKQKERDSFDVKLKIFM